MPGPSFNPEKTRIIGHSRKNFTRRSKLEHEPLFRGYFDMKIFLKLQLLHIASTNLCNSVQLPLLQHSLHLLCKHAVDYQCGLVLNVFINNA